MYGDPAHEPNRTDDGRPKSEVLVVKGKVAVWHVRVCISNVDFVGASNQRDGCQGKESKFQRVQPYARQRTCTKEA